MYDNVGEPQDIANTNPDHPRPTRGIMVDTGSQTDLTIPSKSLIETINLKDPELENINNKEETSVPEVSYQKDCIKCRHLDVTKNSVCDKGFHGMLSIIEDQELIDLTGVTTRVFNLLLDLLPSNVTRKKINLQDRLLIFLMKMKHGLTYSALAVLFGIHRTSASYIFKETLHQLCYRTERDYVPWPSRQEVDYNMPEEFKKKYPKVRVIIDCFEVPVEMPKKIEHRNLLYSHYKGGYRDKFLVGITPDGLISYKSKAYGGRSSDSGITVDCGLCDLLEPGDDVMADKGFPGITTTFGEQQIVVIMPPFNHEGGFTTDEIEQTYSIASVRIHVERAIERIKNYNILRFITHDLQPLIDDIMHMACVLVNLQPPIIKMP
ncbi:hypothetical protein B566_EDAN018697 [Ephemera danica]|nr:hypothetical protein B566_EDAN018697 [Ephemera danica]